MSKKQRGKSGSTAAPVSNKWEAGLLAAPIDEDEWTSSITLVVPNKIDDIPHIDVLGHAVQSGTRRQFGIISKNVLIEEIKELGSPKYKKTKDSPPHMDICEFARPILESGEEIPLQLLCRLIKFKILWLKQQDQLRVANEKKAASDKDKGGGKDVKGGKGKPKSAAKKGKGGKTPEPPSIKGGTKLKKRGEEDEKTYIDDEPLDGASFYVIVTGFNHPHILPLMAEIGIYFDSVINLSSDIYIEPEIKISAEPPPVKDEKTLALEEEQRQRRLKEISEIESFWKDYLLLMSAAPEGSKVHDTAIEKVTVKRAVIPDHLEDDKDGEKKMSYGLAVYEEVACKAYDILDLKRQHKNFLKNLRLIHVPVQGEDAAIESVKDQGLADSMNVGLDVDMRYYNDLMNTIPQESVSVPLIMYCMLEQIEASELGKEPPSEVQPPPRSDGLEHSLAKHIGSLALKLSLTEDERKTIVATFDLPKRNTEPFKQPKLLNKNDEISFRTDHLSGHYGFNAKEAELAMLDRLPFIGALEFPNLSTQAAIERAASLQEVLHFCVSHDLKPSDVDHIFKQFVFECMNLTATNGEGTIPQSCVREADQFDTQAIPWDHPYPYYRCMVPKPENIVDAFPPPDDEDAHTGLSASPSVLSVYSDTSLKSNDNKVPGLAVPNNPSERGSTGTPSILKKGSMSRSGSRNSVHFSEADEDTNYIEDLPTSYVNPMEELVPSTHKRNLDPWCFAEHLERNVLLQVMNDASFTHPFVDTYYHKRDHCLLVVMHNPFSKNLTNDMHWEQKLHSNVGLRNYQEHVAKLILDWTITEEAKYQATLVSEDVEQDITDAAKAAALAAKESRKGVRNRSKSPKDRKGSAKSDVSKTSNTGVDSYITDSFVRDGSLKQMKAELEKQAKEREEEERLKAEKARQKSGKKTAESASKGKKEDKKLVRSGSKQKQNKDESASEQPPVTEKEPEAYWPFTGYDLGASKLMHVSGKVSTMFPTDGSIIRTERINFLQGQTSVKTSVVKDGNVFMVHILEPTNDPNSEKSGETSAEQEKGETEKPEKSSDEKKLPIGKFSSFIAHLKDGMNISFSGYGLKGEPGNYKVYEPAPYIPPSTMNPTSPGPDAVPAKPSPAKKGKGKDKSGATPEAQEEELLTQVETLTDVEEQSKEPRFQQIYLTSPDGLTLNFQLENAVTASKNSERKLIVKQSYPYKTLGKNKCEEAREFPAMQEASRLIRSDGVVIKTMLNGDAIILHPDGTVTKMTDVPPGQSILQRADSPIRSSSARSGRETQVVSPVRKGKKTKDQKQQPSQDESDAADAVVEKKGQWVTTAPTGERVGCKMDGTSLELKKALISYATDPESGQMMISREDHVSIVVLPDETKIVQHEDGTRITTFFKEIESADLTGSKVKQTFVRVECPGYAALEFNCFTSFCMAQFGTGSLLSVTPEGSYHLYHKDGFNMEVDEEGTVYYVPNPSSQLVPAKVGKNIPSYKEQLNENSQNLGYVLSHMDYISVRTVDPDGNQFLVRNDGSYNVIQSKDFKNRMISMDETYSYGKHAPQFFVVYPDMSGTRLLRYDDIAEYLNEADADAATALLKDPVVENPGVTAITVLKPYVKNISQQWLGTFSEESIIPPGLQNRDLKGLPPKEVKTPGPKFGTKVGKGLAIGSAVTTPNIPHVIECPKQLEIRQIIQFRPLNATYRKRLFENLKKYGDYKCTRDNQIEEIKNRDPRSDDEKIFSKQLLEQNTEKLQKADVRLLYEKITAPQPPPPKITPTPRRKQADIEREKKEREEEKINRTILKKQEVPPYFHSEIGRAFLISSSTVKNAMENIKVLSGDPEALMTKLAENPHRKLSSIMRENSDDSQLKNNQTASSPEKPPQQNLKTNVLRTKATTNESPALKTEDKSFRPPRLEVNVIGQPRTQPVHLPDYLAKASKKYGFTNKQFELIENDVRRQVNTSSVANVKTRGFVLMPDYVDFGTLKEGCTYSFTVFLKNIGIDACRYKIRAPPPSTGLRIIYVPGPVAAGMKAELKLELYALAIGVAGESGVGTLIHDLEICSETDVLYLPIRARILTKDEYERDASYISKNKALGVQFVTDKPPNDYGIIRPRKDLRVASNGSDAVLSFLN